jgi:GPH family glycoside/pentoside/hexuronide:cation symporter
MTQATANSGTTRKKEKQNNLTWLNKFVYGSGDWGRASFNTLRQIFYAIFLTDVVGLDPRLASIAALIGLIWNAISDPLVGSLSDNVHTRWGRRRPFLMLFAIPFSLAFLLLWWAPPWHSQVLLVVHVTVAFMVADTIQSLVTVPYLALTPELAPDYDQRTSITSFRMFCNLVASLLTAVSAPIILAAYVKAGLTQQQGYITIAALFGGLAAIPYIAIFLIFREKEVLPENRTDSLTLRQTLKTLWENTPFRFATGIYVLNWVAFDIISLMLPYYLLYWIARGNLLEKVDILGMKISLESVVLGVLLIVATAAVPFWNWMAQRFNKRAAYIFGMIFWVVVQFFIFSIQQGQVALIIGLAILAGISVSTAHVMPESIFPDVIDWDELRTNARREGMYYGAINFLRKMSGAFAIFFALQVLGWVGYKTPPPAAVQFTQPANTLLVIRLLTGPLIAIILVFAISVAWFYPLTRERQNRIQIILQRRKQRRELARLRRNNPISQNNPVQNKP